MWKFSISNRTSSHYLTSSFTGKIQVTGSDLVSTKCVKLCTSTLRRFGSVDPVGCSGAVSGDWPVVLISQMTRQSCSRFKSFAAVSTQWTYMNLQLLLLNQLVTTCHIWKLHEVSKTCWTKANPKRGNQSPFSFLYLHVDDINGCRFQKWSKESDYCHYCLGFAINILLPLYTSSLKQLALMFNKPFGNEKHLANPALGHLVFIPKSSL